MPLDPFAYDMDSKRYCVSRLNFKNRYIKKIQFEKVKMGIKLLFLGAIGSFYMATPATLVSDRHGIGNCFNGSEVDHEII